jgi:hypothetical protein
MAKIRDPVRLDRRNNVLEKATTLEECYELIEVGLKLI